MMNVYILYIIYQRENKMGEWMNWLHENNQLIVASNTREEQQILFSFEPTNIFRGIIMTTSVSSRLNQQKRKLGWVALFN